LGNLFRYRNTSKLKRNLMVFLHPVILRDPAQGNLYTSSKYSYIRQEQLAARDKGVYLLPDVQSPVLKPQEEVKTQGSILNTEEKKSPPPVAPPSPPEESAGFGFNNR